MALGYFILGGLKKGEQTVEEGKNMFFETTGRLVMPKSLSSQGREEDRVLRLATASGKIAFKEAKQNLEVNVFEAGGTRNLGRPKN